MTIRLPRARRRGASLLVLVGLAALTAVGCSNDGKTLRSPPPGVTAPVRVTSTTAGPLTPSTAGATPGVLSLTSNDFQPGGPLTDAVTCAGDGRSPALAWAEIPDGTVEVGIVATDADDDLFTNWVIAGLDPAAVVEAGSPPADAVEPLNSNGSPGYDPFCPPPGVTHLVEFTLYALLGPSGVRVDMTAAEAVAALNAAPGTRAVVTASATGP
jgi:phosphatidylethanolamine-binding protein (PEBP) family uncharacterized protein